MLARELFEAQRSALRVKALTYQDRMDALRALEQALLRHKNDIVRAISEDFGGRAARFARHGSI